MRIYFVLQSATKSDFFVPSSVRNLERREAHQKEFPVEFLFAVRSSKD